MTQPLPLHLVVLDDNNGDCELIRSLVEELNTSWDDLDISVSTFTEVRPCLDYLATHENATLILDYLLGSSSGLDVLSTLRSQADPRPVIVLTGMSDERKAAELGRAGADDYLPKDQLSAESLQRVIQSSMEHQQLRLQRAMLQAQHHEAQKMEAIGVLAGGLAHDFNNMLASIMGFAELATMKYKRSQDITRELSFVTRGCQQMADLVQQLVRFSTRNEPDLVRLRIGDIVEDTVTVLQHSVPKNIKVVSKLQSKDLEATANAGMLQQTLLNICVNAADAMPDGGILELSIDTFTPTKDFLRTHRNLSEGEYVRLAIRDTGNGIPQEIQARIFEPFFTTKPLSSNKGTGLGLATVWHNVKAHEGDVDVESEVGVGTTITIYLPLSLKANTDPPDTALVEAPTDGSEFLMVVDDEELVSEMAQALLEEMGYAVCVASSGNGALQLFRANNARLDAVILDISMPDMDGRNVFRRMREINPDIPILFATGHDASTLSEDLLNMGATSVIQKPFIYGELSQKVRLAIDGEG